MYKLSVLDMHGNQSCVIRIEDNAVIPFDPANVDYQAYLKWIEAGNTPEPADIITNSTTT